MIRVWLAVLAKAGPWIITVHSVNIQSYDGAEQRGLKSSHWAFWPLHGPHNHMITIWALRCPGYDYNIAVIFICNLPWQLPKAKSKEKPAGKVKVTSTLFLLRVLLQNMRSQESCIPQYSPPTHPPMFLKACLQSLPAHPSSVALACSTACLGFQSLKSSVNDPHGLWVMTVTGIAVPLQPHHLGIRIPVLTAITTCVHPIAGNWLPLFSCIYFWIQSQ